MVRYLRSEQINARLPEGTTARIKGLLADGDTVTDWVRAAVMERLGRTEATNKEPA